MSLKGARVLVTGAGGFIGSHLAERLVAEGAMVRAFVHYNALNKRGWLDQSELAGSMDIFAGDITDRESVKAAATDVDVIFHLAALVAIPYSYAAPASYVRTNIEGTLSVLQAAREKGISRIIHTSTSEVYGTARTVPICEDHPLAGQSPYSATKIGADKIAESFFLSFGTPVVTIRPFNTFGPRQSERAVLPTIITQCLRGKAIRLGSLTPTRDFNFVSNTVDGFVAAAKASDVLGETINLGSGREISVGDVAQLIGRICERELIIEVEPQRMRPLSSEVGRLLADNAKAQRLLGWTPRVSLEEGLALTIEWFQRNFSGYKPGVYTV